MHRHLKVLLLLFVFALAGCPPTSGPGPNPPTITWSVYDFTTHTPQTLSGPNAVVHVSGGDSYMLTFGAQAPGGLTAMTLDAQGNPVCSADNGTGGIFTIGNRPVSFPPQSTTFNPTVSSNSLLISPFVFFKIDCQAIAHTDNGPKEAYASSGTITLTGTATDTVNRKSTGTLQVQLP
jgi:hypothetical protein